MLQVGKIDGGAHFARQDEVLDVAHYAYHGEPRGAQLSRSQFYAVAQRILAGPKASGGSLADHRDRQCAVAILAGKRSSHQDRNAESVEIVFARHSRFGCERPIGRRGGLALDKNGTAAADIEGGEVADDGRGAHSGDAGEPAQHFGVEIRYLIIFGILRVRQCHAENQDIGWIESLLRRRQIVETLQHEAGADQERDSQDDF